MGIQPNNHQRTTRHHCENRARMSTETERQGRIEALAKTVLQASNCMEKELWIECQRLFAEASRQSRVLSLVDREKEKS